MSEAVTTTGWENIAQDFGWFPGLLTWSGNIVAGFGPVLALAGAIYLYYKTQSVDREEARRAERQGVYTSVLRQCGVVWNELTSGPHSKDDVTETIRLGAELYHLKILAPKNIWIAALQLKASYSNLSQYTLGMDPAKWNVEIRKQDGEHRRLCELIVENEKLLTDLMREDLGTASWG